MNLLHITDSGNGVVEVSWRRGDAIPRRYPSLIPFANPLSPKDRNELRWYLEDYLQFPYGAEAYRARLVEQEMAEWGESLFEQVFIKAETDPDPRGFYQEAVREGLDQCELCVTSDDRAFLNIPWELMRDPTPGRGYLAPLLGGLYRQRTSDKIEAPPQISPNDPFRILLVIARPYGERDIPLGTVARPMLQALRSLRPRIHLDLLRPPTFEALQRWLNARPGYYQLVHFDGHGVFARISSAGPLMQYAATAERGHLVFEKEDATEHIVNSQDLGQVLATCKVPLFVLNACQSAEEGKIDPFSSVASQLVAIGAQGVVAMSYSVYASAASRFVERFYERLVRHVPLAQAVAEARRRLYAEPDRESVVGNLELRDWMVPALYQQKFRYVPIPEEKGVGVIEEKPEEAVLRQRAEEVCPEGRFGFIGRDYDLLRLERALRDEDTPWALITGVGGTGKTELARGFARWYAETGGCPGGVFATSFKEKADFGRVIGSIVGHGTDFSRLQDEEQWQRLVAYLRENACLLIWDNFEPVAGYPPGEVPLATDEERARLARFLKVLRGGRSRVILTTRKPDENWLGIAYNLIEVRGLTTHDAAQMAKAILKTVGRRPEDFRADPDYARLIRLLTGHPRSLEVVLPQLRNRTPAEIIEALQHRVDRLGESVEDASLGDAFAHLSARTRLHLPFVGLFVSYVHASTLGSFVSAGDEQEQVYTNIMGEALDAPAWEAVLDEAARSGLVCSLGSHVYELHPTFPPFLRRQLLSMGSEKALKQLDSEFMKFYAAWAYRFYLGVMNCDQNAVAAIAVEEANLLRALRLALQNEQWLLGQRILQTLKEFYEVRSRTNEWKALRDRVLARVGREISTSTSRDRADLWMYMLGDEAADAIDRNELATAETANLRVLEYLISLNDPHVEWKIAVGYHQLGIIAEHRHQLDQARQWYLKALAVRERLGGLEKEATSDYHHLGNIALGQGKFDEAEQWYHKSLEVKERLGLEREAASDYDQLGKVAEERLQLDQAEHFYHKALEIYDRMGLKKDVAGELHHLGIVAQGRYQLDQAQQLYRKALAIFEGLGLEKDAAPSYYQLGRIAEEQERLDEAEQWYYKALEIFARLELESDTATVYHQLGNIAQNRQQFNESEQWYGKALEIYERLGLEREAADTYHQLGITAEAQEKFDEAERLYHKALEIFERLGSERDIASSYHQLGGIAYWREQFDEAERWYRRAMELKERLGHPPLMVTTLGRLGLLYRQQSRFQEAIEHLGKAFTLAVKFQMRAARTISIDLVRLMKAMGEEKFLDAWRQAFEGQEPPLGFLREVLAKLESR